MRGRRYARLGVLAVAVLFALLGGRNIDHAAAVTGTNDALAASRSSTLWPGTAPSPLPGSADADPASQSHHFFGTAAINGDPAAEGMPLVASIGGRVCGHAAIQPGGTYVLDVVSAATIPGCGTTGATVRFELGGRPAGSALWSTGAATRLDLVIWRGDEPLARTPASQRADDLGGWRLTPSGSWTTPVGPAASPGSISGAVSGAAGAPMSGASVAASPRDETNRMGLWPGPDSSYVTDTSNPSFNVWVDANSVHGYDWPDEAEVTLLINDPGTGPAPDYSDSQTAGPAPWDPGQIAVVFDFEGAFDVEPGHIVTLIHDITVKTHTVTNLALSEPDPDTDIVSGTAEPSSDVWVGVCDETGCVNRHEVVGEGGDWAANFSIPGDELGEDDTFDIVPGTQGNARQPDEDGNATGISWRVPNPYFDVFAVDDQVQGWEWPLGAEVTLLIDDPDILGTVNYSDSQTVVVAPWNPNQTWVLFDFEGSFDVEPGHTVTLTDFATARNHTVTNLAVTDVNPDTDTVSGTAEAGSDVDVWVHGDPSCQVVVDPDGNWTADCAAVGSDIVPGTGGGAREHDEDGDGTRIHWRVPNPRFWVSPLDEQVNGADWPLGADVTLLIDDPDILGPVDYSDSQTVVVHPWDPNQTSVSFDFGGSFDVEPDHIVTLTDGTTAKNHTVTNLAVTDVDPDTNIVSGTAEPGTDIQIQVCDEAGCVFRYEEADSGGDWAANFATPGDEPNEGGTYDIVPGTEGDANQWDDDGDGTHVHWRVPNPRFTVWPTQGSVDGYEWPDGAEVCLSIDDLDPEVSPDHFECQTAGYVPWHSGETWVGFDLRGAFHVQPGYIVTMADGVTTKTHTVTSVAVTAVDPAADTVTGTAAPGSEVWVDAWGPWGVSRHEVAGGGGGWTADFSTPGDEPNEGGTFDIIPGTQGMAGQYDDDGDETGVIWTPGGTISGTVTDSAPNIVGAWVEACPFTGGGPCSGGWTASDGTYTTGLVAAGEYRVEACAAGYVCEYYDDTFDWGAAIAVPVTEGENASGINFSLRVEGTISGTVTDPYGTPIAGAPVWANPYSGYGSYGSATTGPDGTYTIGGLATGDYRVQACATGYVCEYYDDTLNWNAATAVPVTEGGDTPGIDFGLRVEGTISGTVTDSGGSPIVGAQLSAYPYTGYGSYGYATTGVDGTYTIGGLATGDYRVQVWATGYAYEYYDDTVDWSAATPVPVTEGDDTPGINFSLAIEGTISGTVTGPGGAEIGGASVYACPFTGSGYCGSAWTASNGTYTIGGLPTGDYRVEAWATGYAGEYYDDTVDQNAATAVPVVEGADTPGIDFSLAIEGTISGTVTGPGGAEIGGASVWACPFTGSGYCQWASTASNGAYTIGGLATGDYLVQVCATGYVCEYYDDTVDQNAATAVPVVEGADTPGIDFGLAIEGTISGTVTDPGGSPIADGSVQACRFTGGGSCSWGSTAPDGSYTIGGLATGDYRIEACATGYACEYYDDTVDWSAATPVPVTEGDDTPGIDFSLAIEGTISGMVTDPGGSPIADGSVQACRFTGGGSCSWGSFAPDGTYTIGRLATGDYSVQACATGYVCEYYDDHVAYGDADPVAVTEGADTPGIDFGLAEGGTICGTVTDASGEVEGAGVSAHADAYDGAFWRMTSSQSDGSYVITGLPAGSYHVVAGPDPFAPSPPWVTEFYEEARWPDEATLVEVTPGPNNCDVNDINFTLEMSGSVSGTVTDADELPIEGANVCVDPCDHQTPWWWEIFHCLGTDPDGTYTNSGLATGCYIVRAEAEFYATEYYDDTPNYDDATPVSVVEGSDTTDIDFSLSAVNSDGDGCADVEELGPDPLLGGQRDPLNPWDFFDVPLPVGEPGTGTKDQQVDGNDALAVLSKFGASPGDPFPTAPKYDEAYDRSAPPAVYPDAGYWRTGAPDGVQDANDALWAIWQFGHSCVLPP